MAVPMLKSKGPWWELSPYVRARETFKTHGSLGGVSGVPGYWPEGQLPDEYKASLAQADYVVFSYRTPIAWHLRGDYVGESLAWVIPDVKYSNTTSAQQSKIRACIQEYAS